MQNTETENPHVVPFDQDKIKDVIYKAFPDRLYRISTDAIVLNAELGMHNNFFFSKGFVFNTDLQDYLLKEDYLLLKSTMRKAIDTGNIQVLLLPLQFGKATKYIEGRILPADESSVYVIAREYTNKITLEKNIEEQKLQALNNSKLASLGEMAAGIAHEINNPLAIIDCAAGIMEKLLTQENIDREKLLEVSRKVSTTVERITKITNGLKKFSRPNDGAFTYFNIKKFVEETLSFCSQRFKNSDIDLKIENQLTSKEFYGSEVELSQVFINLLNNSYDAVVSTKNKWIHVKLTEDEEFFYFRITDSGPGIPEKIKDKVFTPFFTTKSKEGGTGLGLSISKNIIERHQGVMSIDGAQKNTSIFIAFPRLKPELTN